MVKNQKGNSMGFSVEDLNSISKLKALGFIGQDISLEESLFEYGMAWKELDNEKVHVIYANPDSFYVLSDDELMFWDVEMSKDDIDIFEDDKERMLEYYGMDCKEWDSASLGVKISDLAHYHTFEDVFGPYYGGFKINKG